MARDSAIFKTTIFLDNISRCKNKKTKDLIAFKLFQVLEKPVFIDLIKNTLGLKEKIEIQCNILIKEFEDIHEFNSRFQNISFQFLEKLNE
jgi:hypothetical protein